MTAKKLIRRVKLAGKIDLDLPGHDEGVKVEGNPILIHFRRRPQLTGEVLVFDVFTE